MNEKLIALFAYGYVSATVACFISAIWTQDLRWLGTGIVLCAVMALVNQMARSK